MSQKKILAKDDNGRDISLIVDRFPDICPLCHTGIDPRYCYACVTPDGLQIVFQCPCEGCQLLFIGYYRVMNNAMSYLMKVAPTLPQKREFSNEIMEVSETFSGIFNEALHAEAIGLTQISGPGYGKALEFLIKDYAISREADESKQDEIKKKLLSQVIKDHISDENIRTTAELAAWLRNDETHYIRKWTDMNISNLKTLIELTIRWIESEEMTRSYKSRMSTSPTESH